MNMKQKLYSLLLTALLGMLGMPAWAQDLTTTEIDGVTYYEIGTAADLTALSQLVNAGEFTANAVLTADIDMADEITENGWTAIGDWGGISGTSSACYKGHFDGQGHTITGFNATATHNYFGIFGVISTGALIENFNIYGTVSCDYKTMGVVGYARDATPTIRNIHSYLTINNTVAGNRHGGILGSSVNGTIVIENCTFSGTINVGGVNGNYGGIVGYVNNNVAAIINITNCLFDGELLNGDEADGQCGGIIGYNNSGKATIKNCLSIGTLASSSGNVGQFIGRLNGANTVFVNNYYIGEYVNGTSSGASASGSEPVQVTEAQLASGEVCYELNGDQTEIGWYQTLGTDQRPTLDATHAQVYMTGRLHCDGTPYEGSTFTNEETEVTQDDHNIVDGFCSYCGLFFEDYLTPNEDGYYEISTPNQLKWFATFVDAGNPEVNAKLTSDIDLTDVTIPSIGNATLAYAGEFDGQEYKITNFKGESAGKGGLFGYTKGATVKNFSISGTLKATASHGSGVVGWIESSYISNIHSTLEIEVPVSGVHHVGGVVGSAQGGNHVDRCTFSGSMTVATGSTDNFAGVVAYLGGDSISNCANYGTITFLDAGCAAGGVTGYLNNTTTYVRNCLNIGSVVCTASGEPKYGGAIIGRIKNNWSSSRVINNYWLAGSAYGPSRKDDGTSPLTASADGTSTDVMASGEIAWLLNEETFLDVVWRQTIGENNYPVLDKDEAIVYQTTSGYDCISEDDPESFSDFLSSVIENEREFIEDEDLVAYQALINEYKETIESWNDIESYENFIAAYKASLELKESIKQSAAAYAKYVENCEYAINYLAENSVEGEWSDFLKTYLEETIEPNADYPNGSYAYIMENCNLDNEAIENEIAFVNQMLENAIAGGITSGTEITRLLVNANFANEFEGWTTEYEGGSITTGGVDGLTTIARGLNNSSFNFYQTLNELPNGIYMMTINGMFRAGADVTNQFYAGQLYMNNTANYVMSPGEDYVSVDEAEPGVNCLGPENDAEYTIDDDILGYVPKSISGCSYAFSAGRYLNFCATEVTDGNLTVGVRNLGTGMANDWLPFGNLRVYYLGTADDAEEKLAEVLEGYAERARIIKEFMWSDYEDFAQYPNISEELKDQLQEAIDAVDGAAGEEKINLINTFSDLFNQVHACRKAYIAMLEAANNLYETLSALNDAALVSDEVYYEWESEITDAQSSYAEGSVTTEEALAIADKLNNAELIDIALVDGVYQLTSAEDVQLFSILANSGFTGAKAALTNDIDMSELEDFQPIGSSSNPFQGEFDGQNHKISNYGTYRYVNEEGEVSYDQVILSGDKQGFFGYVKNATIQNFSIDGSIEYNGGTGVGVIGWSEGSTFRNIHSAVDIAIPVTSHHIAGIIGDMRDGSKAYNCSYSGTITVTDDNTHDCVGGIGGYSNGSCLYENCANYGNIYYTKPSCYAGGILGYINSTALAGVRNCLNVGTIKIMDGTPTNGGAIIGTARSVNNSTVVNNYWLEGSAHQVSGENVIPATIVTAEQLRSGEICYKLNGDQSEINWYQTIGADEFPVLYDTHKVVYVTEEGTYTNEKVHTGTQDDPFVVRSADDLSNLINLLVSGRMNYVVMEDNVDMADVTDWTPLFNIADQSNGYPFIDFDGQGHVISNLTSNTTGDYAYCGLFGILCGNVRNLGVENATVTCDGGTGILAGYLGHSTFGQPCYVENVWVTGSVTANGYCGGMFGNVACESHIKNCYANVEVNGASDFTGGIIGRVRAKVDMTQVYAAGSINRGGGIIGGGQQDATPFGTYNRVGVWNNTNKNFGSVREGEELSDIIYYDGTNFADMQSQVVAWDPEVWSCDMEPGSYPVLAAFDPDGIKGITADNSKQTTEIYNLSGQRLSKLQKGINIVNGKKILVK